MPQIVVFSGKRSYDDFDVVRADNGLIVFTALDGEQRSDTWLSNKQDAVYDATVDDPYDEPRLDPWDPDTDDDSLTDGQEVRGVTRVGVSATGQSSSLQLTRGEQLGTSPPDPDSDGDGWWDGWIGVYNAGNSSRNVVLYKQHLGIANNSGIEDKYMKGYRDEEPGIQSDEIVQGQVGIHDESEAPIPSGRGANIDNDQEREHSNVHLGELFWGTDPRDPGSHPGEQTQLAVEVDYIEGRDPATVTTSSGISVLDAAERNYGLYGFDIQFHHGEEIEINDLKNTCKLDMHAMVDPKVWKINGTWVGDSSAVRGGRTCTKNITPGALNRWELGLIEDKYHDDPDTLYLLWGTTMRNDEPKSPVDYGQDFDSATPTGYAFFNGAPGTEEVTPIENEFGNAVLHDEFNSKNVKSMQSATMHEVGHVLGIGWADDAPLPIPVAGNVVNRGYEVYSGNADPDKTGGVDLTNETIRIGSDEIIRWSIMTQGTAEDISIFTKTNSNSPIFMFSIEEISTIDLEELPSKND